MGISKIGYSQTVIKMKSEGGVSIIPCKVNGLNLNFIFDTGASEVSISMTEASFMLKNGYLQREDIIGTSKYQDAVGNINEGITIRLREIEIADMKLYNITASVVKNNKAPLLLGQSAMKQLGKFEVDLQNKTLTIGRLNPSNSQLKFVNDFPPLSPSTILGKYTQLGDLRIAEFDFPKIMEWAEAKKFCSILGLGWRLPSKTELLFISKNKHKIANIQPYSYWSSSEVDSENAISILFSEQESYVDKKTTPLFVRAVKSIEKSYNTKK